MTARLFLQLACLFDAEARSLLGEGGVASPANLAEHDRLWAIASHYDVEARALGLVGGTDAAFGEELPAAVTYCPKSERLEAARVGVEDQWQLGERIA